MKTKLEKLERELVSFAESNNLVEAVTNGCDPENGSKTYYFITGKATFEEINRKVEDRLSELDLKLYNDGYNPESGYDFMLLYWPVTKEEISDYPFLGKILWQRDERESIKILKIDLRDELYD